MAHKRIVIGDNKEKDNEKTDLILGNTSFEVPKTASNNNQELAQESEHEPLYENVWGNDYKIINKFDENQLEDRRFYVRAAYMQKIECYTIMDSLEEEPVSLKKPIRFMVIDVSMGGLGVVSDYEMDVGKILVFKLKLDNFEYDIKYKVVYCFPNEDKFRAGLKIAEMDRQFIKHLKILVARISMQSKYGYGRDQL